MIAQTFSTIAIAFVLLGGLLLWFVIGSKGRWLYKLIAIILVPLFMFSVWHALGTFSGWPADQKLPNRIYFIQGTVVEPDNSKHGAIYIWGVPPKKSHNVAGAFDYQPKDSEPRAYRLPYTRSMHEAVQNANALKAKGLEVELRKEATKRNAGAQTGSPIEHRHSVYHAYSLPIPALPRKTQHQ